MPPYRKSVPCLKANPQFIRGEGTNDLLVSSSFDVDSGADNDVVEGPTVILKTPSSETVVLS